MVQATNPKIDELRSRLNADPKSRLFYQLAEELRRASEFSEAERVLRTGLDVYPAYLAAWVSLGRVLREQKKEADAIQALSKALQLDPSNVVAARLVADAWLELGEKAEALEKYKLIQALGHSDEALRNTIQQLQGELDGGAALGDSVSKERSSTPAEPAPAETAEETMEQAPASGMSDEGSPIALGGDLAPFFESSEDERETPASVAPSVFSEEEGDVFGSAADAPSTEESSLWAGTENELLGGEQRETGGRVEEPPGGRPDAPDVQERAFFESSDSPFADAERVAAEAARAFEETADEEPMQAAHDESPFEEPVSGYTAAAVEIEAPPGIHIEPAPAMAETAAPGSDDAEWFRGSEAATPEEEPSAAAEPFLGEVPAGPVSDLHAGDGVSDLNRDAARSDDSDPELTQRDPRVVRLERWLSRVSRREVPDV
jgi:tetratricopeptide (TPR) repeat protein